jgi:hypothetical protein
MFPELFPQAITLTLGLNSPLVFGSKEFSSSTEALPANNKFFMNILLVAYNNVFIAMSPSIHKLTKLQVSYLYP